MKYRYEKLSGSSSELAEIVSSNEFSTVFVVVHEPAQGRKTTKIPGIRMTPDGAGHHNILSNFSNVLFFCDRISNIPIQIIDRNGFVVSVEEYFHLLPYTFGGETIQAYLWMDDIQAKALYQLVMDCESDGHMVEIG
jgi:hypothetical protein